MKTKILLFLFLSSCANILPKQEVIIELPKYTEAPRVQYALPVAAPYITKKDLEIKISELRLYNQTLLNHVNYLFIYHNHSLNDIWGVLDYITKFIMNLSINSSSEDLVKINAIIDAYDNLMININKSIKENNNELWDIKRKYNIP